MSSVAGVSGGGFVAGAGYPQSTPQASAVQPQSTYDPDHDGDQDTPGRIDVKV